MSLFSDFIRNATPEEKRAVYMDVMERATKRQLASLPEGAMRVAPGSDAVVWRINSEHCGGL